MKASVVVVVWAMTFAISDGIASRFNPIRFLLVVLCFLGIVASLAQGVPPLHALTLSLLVLSVVALRYRDELTACA